MDRDFTDPVRDAIISDAALGRELMVRACIRALVLSIFTYFLLKLGKILKFYHV
jgi:hypothetical protein